MIEDFKLQETQIPVFEFLPRLCPPFPLPMPSQHSAEERSRFCAEIWSEHEIDVVFVSTIQATPCLQITEIRAHSLYVAFHPNKH